jgi:hypothetical protein|uniref:Uncharacterized protein n=1 Tax=Siphoviridae sp. ctMsr1 TaxID=2826264 RepID=A0A8S5LUZ4_9CAUD|nr:MAG TPA: hypothetical protein [Siphoviridae sp. ctMsr1]
MYQYPDYLMHYGIPGMKWGVRKKDYSSTSVRAAMARRQNDKVDAGFKNWNSNSKKKENAIDLGKSMNTNRMAYESNRNKQTKSAYKSSKKAYKKALRKNTTYRKGAIRGEVGKDASRKYLSAAKKVKKQLDADPNNKQLKRQYSDLMSKHDIERAKARKAPEVGANRSRKIAAVKRGLTMSAKAAATTAAVGGGLYLVNKYGVLNTSISSDDVIRYAKVGKKILTYMY